MSISSYFLYCTIPCVLYFHLMCTSTVVRYDIVSRLLYSISSYTNQSLCYSLRPYSIYSEIVYAVPHTRAACSPPSGIGTDDHFSLPTWIPNIDPSSRATSNSNVSSRNNAAVFPAWWNTGFINSR